MPRHLLDEVLDARAPAEPPPDPGAVIAWLRSPAGEEWSRARAMADPSPIVISPPWWRARGPLRRSCDPCGAPPARTPKHRRKA